MVLGVYLFVYFFIRRALVGLFDKLDHGSIKEGRNLANRIIETHRRRYVYGDHILTSASLFFLIQIGL